MLAAYDKFMNNSEICLQRKRLRHSVRQRRGLTLKRPRAQTGPLLLTIGIFHLLTVTGSLPT